MKLKYCAYGSLLLLFAACERDFDIEVKKNNPQLIVEAYINNEMREYNYVVLSRSQDYYAPDFRSVPVSNAEVTITEGSLSNGAYVWDPSTRVKLTESNDPRIPENLRGGIYFDPVLSTNPAGSLLGKVGKYYLLEINAEGKKYAAVTGLAQPVKLDSITCADKFVDKEDSNKVKSKVTLHYKDPDTIGNRLLFYRRTSGNKFNFGWGGLNVNRRMSGTDDLTNGQYMRITQPQNFIVGDSLQYLMISVERKVYDFWDSYNEARDNEGPFATPVTLLNTISGENVIGCFSGFSISSKTIVVY